LAKIDVRFRTPAAAGVITRLFCLREMGSQKQLNQLRIWRGEGIALSSFSFNGWIGRSAPFHHFFCSQQNS
jgi:hypothetical protein